MTTTRAAPGKVEATALAIAGPAFAASLLFLRGSSDFDPSLFDAGAVVCVALGLAPWAHRLRGPFAATFVRGSGLALGLLLLSGALVPPFYSAVAPAAVAVVGGTLLQANARRERPTLGLDGGAVALLGLGFALGLVMAADFPEPGRLRLTLLLVAAATLAGLALRRLLLASRFADLAPMPLGILLVATIGGIYLSYRGLVQEHVANLTLYEWTLAASASALVLARLRRGARETATGDAWSGVARRHAQDVRPVYDARMGPLAAAVGRWLEQGVGFDAYRAALEAHGFRVPESTRALAGGRGRASRREAAAQRLAAHEAILRSNDRGPEHGVPQPHVR